RSLYTPDNPVHSAKGAVVINIADIPAALTAVMRANGVRPDFAPEGTMELKPVFMGTRGLAPPSELQLEIVEAPAPYNEQVEALKRQIGTVLPRQTMKDT